MAAVVERLTEPDRPPLVVVCESCMDALWPIVATERAVVAAVCPICAGPVTLALDAER